MTFTALLLTGGQSRRMGTDKATLLVDGHPLWQRQLATLRALSPQTILVSARSNPDWLPPDVTLLCDEPPSRGPLSGLTAALRALRTTHLLALAIDLPHMTADHLRSLQALTTPGCGVLPMHGGFAEPLAAIYPAEACHEAVAALASDDVSLQSFTRTLVGLNRMKIHALSAAKMSLYQNWNTPADRAIVNSEL